MTQTKIRHEQIKGIPYSNTLFFDSTDSDVSTYDTLTGIVPTNAVSAPTTSITGDTLVKAFIAPANTMGFLEEQTCFAYVALYKTGGTKNLQGFLQLYHRTSGGTETLIGTSNYSPILSTNVLTEVEFTITIERTVFASTDRLVVKVLGHQSGSGTDPSLTFNYGGVASNSLARISLSYYIKPYLDTIYAPISTGLIPYTSTNNVYRANNPTATSTFTALINGAPTNVANSVVTFDTITVGNATVITPQAAGQLARMRLYNNTRGNYALVVSVSGSTVTVDRNVTTLAAPWQDNDSISTLATSSTIGAGTAFSGSGVNYCELEIVDATLLSKSALFLEMTQRSTVATEALGIHPYVAYSASKESIATCTVANIGYTRLALIALTGNVFGIAWQGTNNTATILKVVGYQP